MAPDAWGNRLIDGESVPLNDYARTVTIGGFGKPDPADIGALADSGHAAGLLEVAVGGRNSIGAAGWQPALPRSYPHSVPHTPYPIPHTLYPIRS